MNALIYLIRCPEPAGVSEPVPLDDAARLLRARGLSVSILLGGDQPLEDVLGTVASAGVELLAMGIRGHGALRHLVSGGVPSRVIQRAPVPVLALRHDATVLPGVARGRLGPRH